MKRMSTAELANSETRYGVLPIFTNERIYSFWDTFWVAGAYGIATWCYFQGGALAQVLSFQQAMFSTLGIACGVVFLIALVGLMSNRYGIDHWIYLRSLFGWIGTPVLLLTVLISTWGYEAINAQMYGAAIVKMANVTGADISEDWAKWIGLTCILFGWIIAIYGATVVKLSTRLMGLFLLLTGLLIVVTILLNADMSELWNAQAVSKDAEGASNYMIGVEWNVAFMASWFAVIGTLGRLGKSGRATFWGMWWGYGLMFGIFIVIGVAAAFVGIAMGADDSGDPTSYLMQIGGPGLGLISVAAIAIANITTQAVAIYLMSVSTKILNPEWSYRVIATGWTALCLVLTAWGGIWDYYNVYLAVVGIVNGPALALIVVDFWVLRRGNIKIGKLFRKEECTYSGGFNLVAIGAFAAGCIAYLAIYDPLSGVPRVPALFNMFTATGFASLVASGLYIVMALTPAGRRYLRL